MPAPRNITATDAERAALFSTPCAAWLRLLMLLCSDTALRSGTARRILGSDLDAGSGCITFVTKWGQRQSLPVTPETAALLIEARRRDETVPAIDALRGSAAPKLIQRPWAKHRAAAGVTRPVRLHDLRRTTAVAVYELTRDLRMVQALLGHRNLPTTLHYLDHRLVEVPPALLIQAARPRTERVQ